MNPLVFPKGALLRLNGTRLSDHNRGELSMDIERIEEPRRMANGTMRKYVVADKRSFSVNWTDLPHSAEFTVDGFWGANEMETFYSDNYGSVTLQITRGNNVVTTHTVMISDFSKTLNKRGLYDFYDVSMKLEEV